MTTPPPSTRPSASLAPLLAVDIGNTSITLGMLQRGRLLRMERTPSTPVEPDALRNSIRRLCGDIAPEGVVFASVVPACDPRVLPLLGNCLPGVGVLILRPDLDYGIPVSVPDPSQVGADRLANACGAAARFGTPVVAADFGTALTFDVILSRRGYIGGIIEPGAGMIRRALSERTALLPDVEPAPVRVPVGRTTEEALRLGFRHALRGMVRETVHHLRAHLPEPDFTLVVTGGEAGTILRGLGLGARSAPDLTLYGMAVAAGLNPHRFEAIASS